MSWQPTDRELRRMRRREQCNGFRTWLTERVGFVPPSWAHHITGISKAAISKAVAQGRVRAETYVFPSGRRLLLVSLQDCSRLEVFRKGWGEFDEDSLYARRQARRRGKGHPKGG